MSAASQVIATGEDNMLFRVSKIASLGEVIDTDSLSDWHQLRGQEYVHRRGILDEGHLSAEGKESDLLDDASVHFLASQQSAEGIFTARAGIRLILKSALPSGALMPVEECCSDLFTDPAAQNAAEASRLISRHPDRQLQRLLNFAILRAVFAEAIVREVDEVYALIETHLVSLLEETVRIPFIKLSEEPRLQPQYNTARGGSWDYPVLFKPEEVFSSIKRDTNSLAHPYLAGIHEHKGLGFFNKDLVTPIIT